MPTVDELFKKPYLPSNKRKLESIVDPKKSYKSPKLSQEDDQDIVPPASAEDEDEEGTTLSSQHPSDAPDDGEGRFFGGGVSKETTDALDFIDERGQEDAPERIDVAYIKKLALNFEKRISKNAEMRAKHDGNPQKYMASEADLDAEIKALSVLSEKPELYSDFVKLGCVASLVSLLSHENTDIAIDAIEIINELTDEDVELEQQQWDTLVDALLEADLLSLLYDNISRLDESIEADRAGVYQILSLLENLASQPILPDLIGLKTEFLSWLLGRVQRKGSTISQNTQYAAEILTVLLQNSKQNRNRITSLNGVDVFLQLLSDYRKRDPAKGTEEEEYVENIFDAITCCVDDQEAKDQFLEAEGVELILLMVKAGNMSKDRAIRLLDHALEGSGGDRCSERLIDAAGLKPLFGTLMKKHDPATTPHLISILSSLLRSLPPASPQRIRLLAKFVERDYQAVSRLCSLYANYAARLNVVNRTIERERRQTSQNGNDISDEEREVRESEYFSRRMDAGLYSVQTCCIVLAWIAAEDEGARRRMGDMLKEQDLTIEGIKAILVEQLSSAVHEANGTDTVEDVDRKAMLEALIQAID